MGKGRIAKRFVAVWFLDALAILLLSVIFPEMIGADTLLLSAIVALVASLAMAALNFLIRPLLIKLTMPLNPLNVGVLILFINAIMLIVTSWFVPGFAVAGLGGALLGAIILALINTFLVRGFGFDDDLSFYSKTIEKMGKKQQIASFQKPGRGIIMLEIDGLSYNNMKLALEKGYMPAVAEMLEKGNHKLSTFDCGIPSMTSSSQAGIFFGDNHDIPAFRWYDKDKGKMVVSSNFGDASEINSRLSKGKGLLRGGTSINNMLDGDAVKTLFTMSSIKDKDSGRKKYRKEDLYLMYMKPHNYVNIYGLMLAEVITEFFQGMWQVIRGVRPRINRLHKGFPFVRGFTNSFMREISSFIVGLDVSRGTPAIYTTFLGYDEVAHHSGPDRKDALRTLKGIDRQIGRISYIAKNHSPREYDLFVLSDHGQAIGATFKQRYGKSLDDIVKSMVEEKTKVDHVEVKSYGEAYKNMVLGEFKYTREHGKRKENPEEKDTGNIDAKPKKEKGDVVVGVSGNLANVYFNFRKGKIPVDDINKKYPGLVENLVKHPGIGIVVAYDKNGNPFVMGKGGEHDLVTGKVKGKDPLKPYGDPSIRAKQLLRLARFPHAGDLILNSTVYPDGQVAAFEELVGSHGGLGGEQTDAIIVHPADMTIPKTTNSCDMFNVLNARRGVK